MHKFNRFFVLVQILLIAAMMLFSGCGRKQAQPQETSKPSPAISPATPTPRPVPKAVKDLTPSVKKVTFESKILKKAMNYNIYFPKGYNDREKYPVLYMFHGYSGNEDGWMPALDADKKTDELISTGKINPVIVVSPMIENSYGVNSAADYSVIGGDDTQVNLSQGMFEDYIYQELIPFIDANYSTDARRESRYAGGMSMGGWVALHLAFQHPDLFSRVGGHSPSLFLNEFPRNLDRWLYPNEATRKERDPIYIARDKDLKQLEIYLDCGDKDGFKFYEGSKALYDVLQSKGVKSEYHLYPGGHDAAYWMAHVEEYLQFYAGKR